MATPSRSKLGRLTWKKIIKVLAKTVLKKLTGNGKFYLKKIDLANENYGINKPLEHLVIISRRKIRRIFFLTLFLLIHVLSRKTLELREQGQQ
jgi:hypothetical protein